MTKRGPDSHYVVPNPGGGWDLKRGGGQLASSHHDAKQDAIDTGRNLSRRQETEFHINNRDGLIARSDSHGDDPNPPKDRR